MLYVCTWMIEALTCHYYVTLCGFNSHQNVAENADRTVTRGTGYTEDVTHHRLQVYIFKRIIFYVTLLEGRPSG